MLSIGCVACVVSGVQAQNEIRLFIAPEESAAPPVDAAVTAVVLEPGETQRFVVWYEDNLSEVGLVAYQVILRWDLAGQPGAEGTVSYVDDGELGGQSVFIDTDRADYAFSSGSSPVFYAEGPPNGFGVFASHVDIFQGTEISGLAYLLEFELSASVDASGTHVLDFVPLGGIPAGGTSFATTCKFCPSPFDAVLPLHVVVCEPGSDCAPVECTNTNECVDGASEPCVWADCDLTCHYLSVETLGDVGGMFGICEPDGVVSVHDRNIILNSCFTDTAPLCPPINLDIAGGFGACAPDGACDVHDVNMAMLAFSHLTACACGPAPELPQEVSVVGEAYLTLDASRSRIRPGDTVNVSAWISAKRMTELQSYQLQLGSSGGASGHLDLLHITVGAQPDVFDASNAFVGTRLTDGLIARGLDPESAMPVSRGAIMATWTYQASLDARGTFVLDIRSDPEVDGLTALIAPNNGRILIGSTTPAVVNVASRN
jgi:hypothetical protein